MKTFEKILIKIIVVQCFFLFITQIVFHHYNHFPELKKLTQYEGVGKNNYTDFLETLSRE
ncbi:YpfB family protein [Bacillus massilinigeriensis]|uniref:YpfB family protein n=1 Tax=Bacillus massilionigeriensis TaxID=1805475 RepID=UPI00096B0E47|nr:YpfB family protein [Bacillus massilionigeriensis]